MGYFANLCCVSDNHTTEAEVDTEKHLGLTGEQSTAKPTGFLSSFCSTSSRHTADKPKPKDKPPKYNRHNLPSVVMEDPPPWVTNYSKLNRRSDGTLTVTPPPQA